MSDVLQELDGLEIVSDSSCQNSLSVYAGYDDAISDDMLCAGGNLGQDGCQAENINIEN